MNTPYTPHISGTQKLALALIVIALLVAVGISAARAQALIAPTRIGPADWQCLDASGAVLSNHQRFDTGFVACYNNAQGAEIVGGRYRINRAPPPDTEPPECPAKPGDESRDGSCPAGTTGSWTQTRTHASVASPICWQAGEWLPVSPPAGACVTAPPATLPAPAGISATTSPNATNPGNHDVALSWLTVAGATGYEVERCIGASCASNFIALLPSPTGTTYTNSNVPSATTYRYRIRGTAGSVVGAWSALRTVTTPTSSTPPPPPGSGTARMSWDTPTLNTDGTPATIAGYRFLYSTVGTAGPSLSQTLNLGAVNAHEFTGLTTGRWAFSIIAIDNLGRHSQQSNIAYRDVP